MEDLLPDKSRLAEFAYYTTSFFLIGWAVGGLIFGSLGDRFGRAKILTLSVLSTGLHRPELILHGVLRFLCVPVPDRPGRRRGLRSGRGAGGGLGADQHRAPALGLLQSLSTWGNIAAGLAARGVGALAARHLLPFGLKAWHRRFSCSAPRRPFCARSSCAGSGNRKWVKARAAAR
jgi:MFS family permease